MDLQQRASTASWLMLVGEISPAWLSLAEACPGPALFVLADAAQEQRLREAWMAPWPSRWQTLIHLVGEHPQACSWYTYNDPRRNGVASPEELRPLFPNLRLLGIELRESITLAALQDSWDPAQVDGGLLALIDDGALTWLSSAADRLNRVATLLVMDHGAVDPLSFRGVLAEQLANCWLAPGCVVAHEVLGRLLLWERDQQLRFQRTVLLERDRLRADHESIQSQLQILEEDKARLFAERDEVTSEREALSNQMAVLEGEKATLVVERDGVMSERDALSNQVAVLEGEKASLEAQRDGVMSERDALSNQVAVLEGEKASLEAQRDGVMLERDALSSQVAVLEGRMTTINNELDDLLALINQRAQENINHDEAR